MALNAVLMTFTHIPACQQWLGEKVAYAIGQKLNTEVSIGRIDVGFLNRLIIDDVLMKDQQHKDMLQVGRMSVKIAPLSLATEHIVITSAQIFNAHAMLYRKDAESDANFQFVIDALSSKDSTQQSTPKLSVNSLIVRHSSVTYDQQDVPRTSNGLQTKHLKISDISAYVLLNILSDDALSVNVKRLSLKEQSGLVLSRLSFMLERNKQDIQLSNFFLQLPRSSFNIESMSATADFDNLQDSLSYDAQLIEADVVPRDLAFLYPKLAQYKSPVKLKASINGTANGMNLHQLQVLSTDGNLSFNASGWVHNWSGIPVWHANITRAAIANELFENIRKSNNDLPELLFRMGNVAFRGEATGHEDGTIDINGQLTADVGELKFNGYMTHDQHFAGHVNTKDLHLGKLLDVDDLGLLAAEVEVNGSRDRISIQGEVPLLEYNQYAYHQISLDGSYQQGDIAGKLQIDDPYIVTNIEGELKRQQATAIRLTGYVNKLVPKALNWSDQWGNATFSAIIDADFSASTLNDANGSIDIDDFVMRDSVTRYEFDNLHIKSGFDEGIHYLKFNGDMGEGELTGHFDWATLSNSFVNYVASKLPTLPGLPKVEKTTDNDFKVRLHLKDARWLRHLLGVNLSLSQPLQLQASVNDKEHKISVNGRMPQFLFNDSKYEGGRIDITSPGDTMICEISATHFSENDRHMSFGVQAIAANNNLMTSLHWNNHQQEKNISGELNTNTTLYRNIDGMPEAHVYILPSHAVMGDTEWNVEPGGILYNAKKMIVDHLSIVHGQQHIIVDGIASESSADSLKVDLNDVEVAYILDLVNFTAVSFSGKATGKAWAQLNVEQFKFEGGRMGTLHAQAQWNKVLKQIDIQGICDDGVEAMTYIDGFVSPTNDCIDLNIKGRGTYIDFLQTYTSSFLSNVTGNATGDLRLVGPLGEMDLLGRLVVDAKATVTALGTTYTLEQDTIDFVHNDILLNNSTAHDRYQNKAVLNGGIHHENLTQLTFDLDVRTDQLLAYDQSEGADDLFYGIVFAAGEVSLRGRPGEVIINCNATPLEGTIFTYNAANPDAINDQRFITWHDSSAQRQAQSSTTKSNPSEVPIDIPTDLHINFLINTNSAATLRLLMDAKTGDFITLGGSGVIRASYYNKGAFEMFGTYTVERGTYGITIQNIIKKNFIFQPGGTIVFGGAPFDANLNMQALYTVNGVSLSDLRIGNSFSNNTVRVNCLMNIGGQAGAPRVEFDLDMPTVNSEEKQMIRSVIASEQEMNQQVLYLLGIGRFYTQGANNASTQQQYGQSELAMQSFLSGTLSTQINEVLSQLLKSNNWNFGANISTGNEGWHNAEYEGVVSGRMLNNRLLINGQFGYRDNATQANTTFIGDFDIRYLLHPNGNLALKMYNQTNDRYFTHSSLNTQGIGLIIKKDFNGLRDLFHHRKKRRDDN